jgi:hypothetical protein
MKLKHQLGDKGLPGKLILKWILEEQDVRMWDRFIWFRTSSSGGHL